MIIRALALAPIPLLSISALGIIIFNTEFNLYSVAVIFLAHFLFYLLFYGLLVIPFAYITSYFLARKNLFKSDRYSYLRNCHLDFD